jgi:hypothetical protein
MRRSLNNILSNPLSSGLVVCTILFAIWASVQSRMAETSTLALPKARLLGHCANEAINDGDLESIILALRSGKLSSETLTKVCLTLWS